MSIRQYTNNAPPQALTSLLAASTGATAVNVASTAGYPTPPFILGIDRGTSSQEVCLCTAIASGTSFTVTRAYDFTSAVLHNIGATVEHTSAGIDYREPNAFINLGTTLGDLWVVGPSGPTRLPVGTNGQMLVADSTETLGLGYDNPPPATKPFRQVHNYSVSGLLSVPSGSLSFLPPFFVPVPGTQSVVFVGAYAKIRGGTSVTLAVQQNGSSVAGMSAISVTTTPTWFPATGTINVAAYDAFAPVISAVTSAPDGLSLSLYFDITF